MPYDRFGRFYEPGPESVPLLGDMRNWWRAFPVYPTRWEDEPTPQELNILKNEGLIQRTEPPIAPRQFPQYRPDPWAMEVPEWYEPTAKGQELQDRYAPQQPPPYEEPILPLEEDLGDPRRMQRPSPPYEDRGEPSPWEFWGPMYQMPMYPEDMAGKPRPIPTERRPPLILDYGRGFPNVMPRNLWFPFEDTTFYERPVSNRIPPTPHNPWRRA